MAWKPAAHATAGGAISNQRNYQRIWPHSDSARELSAVRLFTLAVVLMYLIESSDSIRSLSSSSCETYWTSCWHRASLATNFGDLSYFLPRWRKRGAESSRGDWLAALGAVSVTESRTAAQCSIFSFKKHWSTSSSVVGREVRFQTRQSVSFQLAILTFASFSTLFASAEHKFQSSFRVS